MLNPSTTEQPDQHLNLNSENEHSSHDENQLLVEDFSYKNAITADDKLWAALCYLLPIFAIIALRREDKRWRPFVYYHAVQSITFSIVLWIIILFVSIITILFGSICTPLIWLTTLWPAYDSYKGNYTTIPYVTTFIKGRGWV